jgi:hypothetical protein
MKDMLTLVAKLAAAQSSMSSESPPKHQLSAPRSEPIRKKPAQPAEETERHANDDDRSDGADSGNDAGDTADSASDSGTSATPTHLIPLIESWLIYANLERLATAMAADFRVHPDSDGDYSFGSPNDRILSARPKTVTELIMRNGRR